MVFEMIVLFGLFVLGAALGSFACCQAWRMRNCDKSVRSHCEACGCRLRWYDNVPVVSWLMLRGKCRKCGKGIGWVEFWAEVGLGLIFVVAGLFYPGTTSVPSFGDIYILFYGYNWLPLAELVVFLILLVPLAILLIYDLRWGELPMKPLTFSIICAIMWVILRQWSVILMSGLSPDFAIDMLGSLLVLPLFYYGLYKFSDERWVGSGDWVLCVPLALVLGNFLLAFVCLFAANLLGSLAVVPMMMGRKSRRGFKIHFGPFLILGFLVVFFAQPLLFELLMIY